MRQFIKPAVICVLVAAFAACSESSNSNVSSSPPSAAKSRAVTGDESSGGAQAQTVSLEQTESSETQAATARKIIRNANLSLEADAPEDAARKIAAVVESKKGFVVSSDTRTSNGASVAADKTVTMIVRVPAAEFDAAVDAIRQNASRVTAEKISGQDVTEEFIDLEAGIRTKKALEAQFLEIMKQSRTVEDALKVQTELATVRGAIEKLEGRRKFLESQTSLSTINITLGAPAAFAGSSNGFFHELGRAFSNGIDGALGVVLFLVTAILALLPLIILFGVPLYLLIRYLRRRARRQKLAHELAQDEKR